MSSFRFLATGMFALALGMSAAHAQDAAAFPSKLVRLVVPASAGGSVDAIARVLADALRTSWNETIVVENKPGAGSSAGTIQVAQSAPDGHTLLVISDSVTINPNLYPNLDKDPLRQFEPISILVTAPQVLIGRKDLGASNLRELIAFAKTSKTPVNIGTAGAGAISHLTQVMLDQSAGIKTSHIPFRGAGPVVTAVLGGHVDAAWVMPAPVLAIIARGQLKALAVTSAERDPALPQVPTVEESGVPNFQVMNWQGLFAPANTPKPIVERIAKDVAEALQRPEVRARMATLGFAVRGDGPQTAADLVRASTSRWADLIRNAGLTLTGE